MGGSNYGEIYPLNPLELVRTMGTAAPRARHPEWQRQHRLLHAEVSTGFFHPVLPQHARGPHPQEQDHDFDGTMKITIHEYLLGYGT